MDRPLEGRVVLVTGAGVRVGRAIAEDLGRAGASIAVHFHSSEDEARDVVRAVRADGNRAAAFAADLSRPEDATALVTSVEEELGPIAALVNSAALFERADLLDSEVGLLDRLWSVNARAPYVLTRAAAEGMMRRGRGDIVNVVDIGGGLVPWAHYSAYCMTKAALAMLTRCLALELAPTVRVNAVAPGTVLPPEDMPSDVLESIRRKIPQQRFGTARDVADVVRFLLTGPTFITGQILAVDGGRSVGSTSL